MQSDPIGLEGGFNTYGYVLQNPINLIDVTGNQPIEGQGTASKGTIPGANRGPGSISGTGTSSPGQTGKPISGPFKAPPSGADKIGNAVLKQLMKQAAKALGIPPSLIAPNKLTLISLLLHSPELGCSSFDCNNNGIDDRLESGGSCLIK